MYKMALPMVLSYCKTVIIIKLAEIDHIKERKIMLENIEKLKTVVVDLRAAELTGFIDPSLAHHDRLIVAQAITFLETAYENEKGE